MESLPKIFADFNNADEQGRLRLTTHGSIESIEREKLKLIPGLKVMLDDDDELATIGVLEFFDTEKIWVAKIDWNSLNAHQKRK